MCRYSNFCQEWGRLGPTARKQSGQLFIHLFVLVLIGVFNNLQKGSNDVLWGNLYFSKDQEGVQQHYQGGGATFQQDPTFSRGGSIC